ncbi:MAG: NADH-quinone oxidoreductase subunit NuoG [Pseudomonadales bacterium]|nr:NADH-quinone oxidoreductase subunit NuoG [Pseudomonadales bacterium]
MAKISVDGIQYEVNAANNLLQECLSQGLDLPYFCWHPCMGSVGACRQCAVKQYRNAEDTTGTLVMACMTPVTDGGLYSIQDSQAVDFRSHVIESLMISHPHDCPVCEEGGECHLQDMTQMSGHNYRRYDFQKVTHRNQDLGPFINHEMNRCIACYRCVRFYGDYAGGTDLVALASHHHVYFGRHEEGTLESEFSGNLVEVCPTGVFTDKTFSAHYSRKWDLQTAPSICTGCGAGCNTTPGERYGSLRRVVNRYHHDLNGYFLCDRGRFGYDANNSAERVKEALFVQAQINGNAEVPARKPLSATEAARQFNAMAGGDVIGIGSPRASLESNIALQQRVGAENFYPGINDDELASAREVLALMREPGLHCPDIRSLEQSDCVLVVNEDLTNTAARMALALRQATRNAATTMAAAARIPAWQDAAVRELAQHERSPLIILSPQGTRLDDVASDTFLGSVARQVQLLEAIAHCLDPEYSVSSRDPSLTSRAKAIAQALSAARRPCIVSGISAQSTALVRASGNLARALQKARKGDADAPVGLCFAMPEANTLGLVLLAESTGNTLSGALQRLAQKRADAAVVLENDLFRRAATAEVAQALAGHTPLIVIDHLHNAFNARARLLLPAASPSESNGTWVNYEGRAQSAYRVFAPAEPVRAAYEWLTPADPVLLPSISSEEILAQFADAHSAFAVLKDLLPHRLGLSAVMKSPRQLPRYSGRTAMQANSHVHEYRQTQDPQSPLSFSMEGVPLQKDASLLSAAWAPGWNSNQAISKFQDEINGELRQGCKGVHLLQSGQAQASYAPIVLPSEGDLAPYFIEHLFGSEEISAKAVAIQARTVGPYACIGEALAQTLGVAQHGRILLKAGERQVQLPVLIRQRIAPGSIGIYCAGELDRYSLAGGVTVEAVPEAPDLLLRSREMFRHLVISDSWQGRDES